jgi:HEAT repeat protein
MAHTSSKTLVRRRLIVIAVALAVLGGIWVVRDYVEPRYAGQSLSHWLCAIHSLDPREEEEARTALQAMGTNAVPFLLKLLRKCEPSIKTRINHVAEWYGIRPYKWKHDVKVDHIEAAFGFQLLGPLGRSAVPELAELLNRSDAGQCVANALVAVEPEGIMELVRALTNSNTEVRLRAGKALGTLLESPDRPQFPSSVVWPAPTRGPDSDIVNLTSTRVVPALIAALQDPDPDVRRSAVRSLRHLGLSGDTVLEKVRPLLQDEDPGVKREVDWTIQEFSSPRVEPDRESKAGWNDKASASP